MKLESYKPILGISITALIWNYGNDGINYISHKLNNFIKNTDIIPNEISKYTTTTVLVGISLGSQIFISNSQISKHSTLGQYVEKTIIGYSYFFPAVFAAGTTEHFLNKYSFNSYIVGSSKYLAGAFIGTLAGDFFQNRAEKHLDISISKVDKVICLILATFSSLIGKSNAKTYIENGNPDIEQKIPGKNYEPEYEPEF